MPAPYNVRRNYRGCSGYSVVSADGKSHGCMKTRRMAIRQQRALYAATQDKKASEVASIENQIIKEYEEEMRKELEIWNGSVISKNTK